MHPGLRIPVATVVGMVADEMSEQEILDAYPDLEAEDIRESLGYAAEAVRERELPQAALLLANLERVDEDLETGAVVVIKPGRMRVRELPIVP